MNENGSEAKSFNRDTQQSVGFLQLEKKDDSEVKVKEDKIEKVAKDAKAAPVEKNAPFVFGPDGYNPIKPTQDGYLTSANGNDPSKKEIKTGNAER